MAEIFPADNDSLFTKNHGTIHRKIVIDSGNADRIVKILSDNTFNFNSKCGFTPEGGFFITLTNKTGGASIKGYLCRSSATTSNAFDYTDVDSPNIIGIVYDNGIADGSECRVIVNGIAEVYFVGNVSINYFARMTISTDTGNGAGKAIAEAFPTSPFATDKHFQEIGHTIESRTGAGLAKCVIHFN